MLSGLYLAGSPHGQSLDRRRWPAVLGALRALGLGWADAEAGFRAKGLIAEATALRANDALDWAVGVAESGRLLACLDPGYPQRWLAILKDQAPPVGWVAGEAESELPSLSVVGSRHVDPYVHRFVGEVARNAVDLGFRVVSGATLGCDQTALNAASRHGGATLAILPYGLELYEGDANSQQVLASFCEPREGFSRGRAMERNALIYAASRFTVVGQVRFREGGTWHGATAAMRRGLTQILVRRPGSNEPEEVVRGARALVALGATYLDEPGQLEDFLQASPLDHGLFASLRAG